MKEIKYLQIQIGGNTVNLEIEPTSNLDDFKSLGIEFENLEADTSQKVSAQSTSTTGDAGGEDLGAKHAQTPTTEGVEEDLGAEEKVEEVVQFTTAKVTDAFDKMTDTIQSIAQGFHEKIASLNETIRPDEVSVEFGVALKAGAGVVVARAEADANFKLTLSWKISSPPSPPKATPPAVPDGSR